jgi:thioredoxin reductase
VLVEVTGQPRSMTDFDVVVIGGGAAGLSAALVLTRARRRVLVVDSGTPRNAPASEMHGFLSRDGFPPSCLLEVGREEVAGYGGQIVDAAVAGVQRGRSFLVRLDSGLEISARRLLVATGLRDELPEIPGLRERWARDVLHCPYCHGFEVRDSVLGVLGWVPGAAAYAQIVRQWSEDVVYLASGASLTSTERDEFAARSVTVVDESVERVVIEDDRLRGVELEDERIVEIDALFVPPRFVPNNNLLVELGCDLDEGGWANTDATGLTSVSGVWVAGNLANPRAQVVTAAGEGSAAAIALNADLVTEDIAAAVGFASGARMMHPAPSDSTRRPG